MAIRMIKEGLFTTIQDLGRFTYKNIGMPSSGAMDEMSIRLTNWLVFNDENTAAIECTYIGPTILFEADSVVAVGGKGFIPIVNDRTYKLFQPIFIKKGEVLKLESTKLATRAYIAVQGGFHLQKEMNSSSTYTRGQIGGMSGRTLQKDDVLHISPPKWFPKQRWFLSTEWIESFYKKESIRFIRGNQADWFNPPVYKKFQENPYTISPQSDRMGYRLEGQKLLKDKEMELVTEGTAPGTIQVPPSGHPIVLMKDGQVTGGYPKIGTVISTDIPVLGQKRPGDQLTFKEVSLSEAYLIRENVNKELAWIKNRIELERRKV